MVNCLLTSFLLLTLAAPGQRTVKAPAPVFYTYDSCWKTVPAERAVYLLVKNQENDSCWRLDYYHYYGPLIKTERYTRKAADIPDGEFVFYNSKGRIDSNHYYHHGVRVNRDGKGKIGREQSDPAIDYTGDGLLYADDERESEFKGGGPGWRKYVMKNFRYPKRALDHKIEGTVIILFMVDESGKVISPSIVQSVEYSLDTEALRIIQTSPRWIPGTQGRKPIKTYKRQPITFRRT